MSQHRKDRPSRPIILPDGKYADLGELRAALALMTDAELAAHTGDIRRQADDPTVGAFLREYERRLSRTAPVGAANRPEIDPATGLPGVPDPDQLRSVLGKLRDMGPAGDAELVELVGIFADSFDRAHRQGCGQLSAMFAECRDRLRRAYSLEGVAG